MKRKALFRLFSLLALVVFIGNLIPLQPGLASFGSSQPSQVSALVPLVVPASRYDVSPDLRSVSPAQPAGSSAALFPPEIPNPVLPKALRGRSDKELGLLAPGGPALQSEMPSPVFNFDGISNMFGGWPPDTQGDIGPNHYIQWINLHFAIWEIDRSSLTAQIVYGPAPGNTLFQGFGGPCQNTNHGDPITLYDPFADRWLMSQFALPNYPNGPFYQCVAVSTSSDPLGGWYRYEYPMPTNKMNDYPKFGVWPDAYFMTVNQYNSGTLGWGGAAAAAFDRAAMLSGSPAVMVFFDLFGVNPDYGGLLPADFDGLNSPPDGAPGYFASWDDGSWIGPQDAVRIWEFNVDWTDPGAASFGLDGDPNWVLPTANVDPSMCFMMRNCIPQPNTTNKLDAISDRLMYRLQYRNFGGYAALVSNHTVDSDGLDHAGIHWFELRRPALEGDWSLYQEGVFAPDAHHRWMGSAALDHIGDLALGYSLSSASVYPSIRFTGRITGDPLGTLPQGEKEIVAGGGSQTSSNRWGDYSMLGIDPVDDCTFWYTQQYVQVSGYNSWKTRIGAFRFPGCTVGPQGELVGTIREAVTGEPIQGAQIMTAQSITQTLSTRSNTAGEYLFVAPIGVYSMTVTAFGYYPQFLTGVEVVAAGVTVQDFALSRSPTHQVTGKVRDAATGWPLYARITAVGADSPPVWSDPVSGFYSLELPEGNPYTLLVDAFMEGYLPGSTHVNEVTEDMILDFDLEVDPTKCSVPGYEATIIGSFQSDFEADDGGLTTEGTTSWEWGAIVSGPMSAHSGVNGWATNLEDSYNNNESGYLSLPALDLSAYPGERPAIAWWQWLETESRYDYASIEASKDGGSTWQAVYGRFSGEVDRQWASHYLTLDPDFLVSDLLLRFRFTSDSSVVKPGWYLDDLSAGIGKCLPQSGGLVTGRVLDANTFEGLNGASLLDDLGGEHLTVATPEDPALGGGFYLMFAPTGTHVFTATLGGGYLPDIRTVEVASNQTVNQDFLLPAGNLFFNQPSLSASLQFGETSLQMLSLANLGGAPADVELVELKGGFFPLGPFEEPDFGVKSFKAEQPTSKGLGIPAAPSGIPFSAGTVIQSWAPSGVEGAWAAGYDAVNDTVWVSTPTSFWSGEDLIAEFSTSGEPTGRLFAHDIPHSSGPADLAYNWNTGMFWIMNVNTGSANCIYEFNPDEGYTGNRICPGGQAGFSTSQRGLAYDPDTDTWFAGGWNDLKIHRFANDGTLLSSVNTGLAISGLAYNPDSGHIFAITNDSQTKIFVLDVANNYQQIGQFSVSEGFGSYAGGGLEFDCNGSLWAVDLSQNRVVQLESGEASSPCERDVSWISFQPVEAAVAAGDSLPIQVTFDAGTPEIDQPGEYSMLLKLREDTPYLVDTLPVTLTISAPATWGKLDGVVTGRSPCGGDPVPLEKADLLIESSTGLTWTIQTDSSGFYQRWLDSAGSPYTVTVSAPGYLPERLPVLQVRAGVVATYDLTLIENTACFEVQPLSLEVDLKTDSWLTRTITLTNSGTAIGSYFWTETTETGQYTDLDWLSVQPSSGSIAPDGGVAIHVVRIDSGYPDVSTPGVYHATLALETEGSRQDITYLIPITLTVLAREFGVAISPDQIGEGIPAQTVDYTLVITNTSEGLTDTFSLEMSSSLWQTWLETISVGPIAAGVSQEVPMHVRIPDSALPAEVDQVVITAKSLSNPLKTAAASFKTTVLAPLADLELGKTVFPDPGWAGQPLTYTLTVTNHGPTIAPETMLVDILSPKLEYLCDDAGCSLAGGVLTCPLGTLPVDVVRTVKIRALPMHTGLLVNQAAVASQVDDPLMDNNFSGLVSVVVGWLSYFPWIAGP